MANRYDQPIQTSYANIPRYMPNWEAIGAKMAQQQQYYDASQAAVDLPIDYYADAEGNEAAKAQEIKMTRDFAQAEAEEAFMRGDIRGGNRIIKNMVRDVQLQYKDPSSETYVMQANAARIREGIQSIDDLAGWDGDDKGLMKAQYLSGWQGSFKEDGSPITFSSPELTEFFEVSDLIREVGKELKPNIYSVEYLDGQDEETGEPNYINLTVDVSTGKAVVIKEGEKTVTLTEDQVFKRIRPVLDHNEKAKAFLQKKQELDYFAKQLNTDTWDDPMNPASRSSRVQQVENAKEALMQALIDMDHGGKEQIIEYFGAEGVEFTDEELRSATANRIKTLEKISTDLQTVEDYNELFAYDLSDRKDNLIRAHAGIFTRDDYYGKLSKLAELKYGGADMYQQMVAIGNSPLVVQYRLDELNRIQADTYKALYKKYKDEHDNVAPTWDELLDYTGKIIDEKNKSLKSISKDAETTLGIYLNDEIKRLETDLKAATNPAKITELETDLKNYKEFKANGLKALMDLNEGQLIPIDYDINDDGIIEDWTAGDMEGYFDLTMNNSVPTGISSKISQLRKDAIQLAESGFQAQQQAQMTQSVLKEYSEYMEELNRLNGETGAADESSFLMADNIVNLLNMHEGGELKSLSEEDYQKVMKYSKKIRGAFLGMDPNEVDAFWNVPFDVLLSDKEEILKWKEENIGNEHVTQNALDRDVGWSLFGAIPLVKWFFKNPAEMTGISTTKDIIQGKYQVRDKKGDILPLGSYIWGKGDVIDLIAKGAKIEVTDSWKAMEEQFDKSIKGKDPENLTDEEKRIIRMIDAEKEFNAASALEILTKAYKEEYKEDYTLQDGINQQLRRKDLKGVDKMLEYKGQAMVNVMPLNDMLTGVTGLSTAERTEKEKIITNLSGTGAGYGSTGVARRFQDLLSADPQGVLKYMFNGSTMQDKGKIEEQIQGILDKGGKFVVENLSVGTVRNNETGGIETSWVFIPKLIDDKNNVVAITGLYDTKHSSIGTKKDQVVPNKYMTIPMQEADFNKLQRLGLNVQESQAQAIDEIERSLTNTGHWKKDIGSGMTVHAARGFKIGTPVSTKRKDMDVNPFNDVVIRYRGNEIGIIKGQDALDVARTTRALEASMEELDVTTKIPGIPLEDITQAVYLNLVQKGIEINYDDFLIIAGKAVTGSASTPTTSTDGTTISTPTTSIGGGTIIPSDNTNGYFGRALVRNTDGTTTFESQLNGITLEEYKAGIQFKESTDGKFLYNPSGATGPYQFMIHQPWWKDDLYPEMAKTNPGMFEEAAEGDPFITVNGKKYKTKQETHPSTSQKFTVMIPTKEALEEENTLPAVTGDVPVTNLEYTFGTDENLNEFMISKAFNDYKGEAASIRTRLLNKGITNAELPSVDELLPLIHFHGQSKTEDIVYDILAGQMTKEEVEKAHFTEGNGKIFEYVQTVLAGISKYREAVVSGSLLAATP